MQNIKHHQKTFCRFALCSFFGVSLLSPAALALPTNIEDQISALNISESEFETELGIETLYVRLQTIAHRICDSGLYQAVQPQSKTDENCAFDMMDSFVGFIGNERLIAYHERHDGRAFT